MSDVATLCISTLLRTCNKVLGRGGGRWGVISQEVKDWEETDIAAIKIIVFKLNHYYQSISTCPAGSANKCFLGGNQFYTHLYHSFDFFGIFFKRWWIKNTYVLSLYIFLEDLYLESQGCQQLQSVDINYQSFTSCDFPSNGWSNELLMQPKSYIKTYGDRAFAVHAPRERNLIPYEIRNSNTISIFKRALETFLFSKCINNRPLFLKIYIYCFRFNFLF